MAHATNATIQENEAKGTVPTPDAIRLRLSCDGYRTAIVLVSARRDDVDIALHTARTGPQPRLVVDWDAHGPCLLSYTQPAQLRGDPLVILPSYAPLGLVPESLRPRGLSGPAPSRRPGEGFEWRDVHPLRPGDSMRRIDWRTTARQPADDAIFTKGTYATGEAVAVLVLDSRDEVGPDPHTWHGLEPLRPDEPTSLDLARNAAASIARRLIAAGGRVGLSDLATGRRPLMPATGQRHLNRLAYALATSAPVGPARVRVRPPRVPTDAIVYLFSTLLDDEPVRLARALVTAGHPVIVVDTLPQIRPAAELAMEIAWRVTAAERAARIRRLAAQHVPVVEWSGDQARARASHRLAALHMASRRPGGQR